MNGVQPAARMLRRQLRPSLIASAVVVGLAGGLASGLFTGARRTDSAAERFAVRARVLDVLIGAGAGTISTAQVEEIRQLPGVEGAASLVVQEPASAVQACRPQRSTLKAGRASMSMSLVCFRGRAADPGAADEIVLRETHARHLGVDVGDVLVFDCTHRPSHRRRLAECAAARAGRDVERRGRQPASDFDLLSDDPEGLPSTLPPGSTVAMRVISVRSFVCSRSTPAGHRAESSGRR